MGAVYHAHDEGLDGKRVVVKVPRTRFLAEPGFRQRFHGERKDLRALEHPHVARFLAKGEEDGTPLLVLAHLAGRSLRDRLGRTLLQEPDEVLQWLPDVARTLDCIHGRGVIHRDVKPANVLFDEYGHVYVSDFGIPKALGASDRHASPVQ
jgi:serine/threonine-protein kinase